MAVDVTKSIFLLVAIRRIPDEATSKPRFLGTCFFTEFGGYPTLVTAKHVIEMADKESDSLHVVIPFNNRQSINLHMSAVVWHLTLDIAFVILNPTLYNEIKSELRALPILEQVLPFGTNVFTFGYPNTQTVLDDATGEPVLHVENFMMKGYITSIIKDSAITGAETAYILSFPAMPGISGAPLLVDSAGSVSCVGFLLKNRTTTQFLEERVDRTVHPERTIHIYRTIDFGIACDSKALTDARGMLEDAARNLSR